MQSHHKVVVTPSGHPEAMPCASAGTNSSENKWKCEVCTYENWPASVRCAMCQSTNNKVLSENQHNNRKTVATTSSTDIYKMGATSLSRSTSPQLSQLGGPGSNPPASEDNAKWPCTLCTYLNWPKALRCTQCLTTRRRVSPGARKQQLPGQQQAGHQLLQQQQQTADISCITSGNLVNSTVNPPSLESLRISTPSPPSKWNCSVCTYENWPRTKKCVLCGALKVRVFFSNFKSTLHPIIDYKIR